MPVPVRRSNASEVCVHKRSAQCEKQSLSHHVLGWGVVSDLSGRFVFC